MTEWIVIAYVLLTAAGVYLCCSSQDYRARKVVWTIMMVGLPFIGLILYAFIGRVAVIDPATRASNTMPVQRASSASPEGLVPAPETAE